MQLNFRRKLRRNGMGYYYLSIPRELYAALGKDVLIRVLNDHIELWPASG